MKKDSFKLDELMSRQPFRVPDGYFENFTDDFMNRLPDKPVRESNKVSFYVRMKPLLYLAAMFVGAIILSNIFTFNRKNSTDVNNKTNIMTNASSLSNSGDEMDYNAEFLEYIEDMYVDKYALSYVEDYMDN